MSNKIEVIGLLKSSAFHFCSMLTNQLQSAGHLAQVLSRGHLEFNWNLYLQQLKCKLEEAATFNGDCVVLINEKFLGGHAQLVTWAQDKFGYVSDKQVENYEEEGKYYYLKYLNDSNRKLVYFDLNCEGNQIGKLVFELNTQLTPKSCDNFLKLCTGEGGKKGDVSLSYQGSILHRMLPNGWIQGGDIVDGSGANSLSTFHEDVFEDESFAIPHDKRGILGYANRGPHTNGSQFYITFQPARWMDRTYVAFGQLVEGTNLLSILESLETYNQRPKKEIMIIKCGVYLGK